MGSVPHSSITHLNYQVLFESIPGLYLVLTPDSTFTIVAASDAYLQATMTQRAEILGRGIFEVFPNNPNDSAATGVQNLRCSLEAVLQNRQSDVMAVQKYDIPRPISQGNGFEERYWSPVNSPVFGTDQAIIYIIHRVEAVTEFVRLKQQRNEQYQQNQVLRDRTEQMEAEIYRTVGMDEYRSRTSDLYQSAKASSAGFGQHLAKPIDPTTLVNAIINAVKR